MFLIEIIAGLAAGSASLQADALDFLADTANYGISLFVVGMALRYRASAALAKGVTMGAFGVWVLATSIWHVVYGTMPNAVTMAAVGVAALVANAASFALLRAYRAGDSNMQSVVGDEQFRDFENARNARIRQDTQTSRGPDIGYASFPILCHNRRSMSISAHMPAAESRGC